MLLAYLRSSNRKWWRSASATWDFDAAQRIVGPPHLGVVGGSGAGFPSFRRRPLDARGRPPRNLAGSSSRGASSGTPGPAIRRSCHSVQQPWRATFVPHCATFSGHLAVFGQREIAFTQRVVCARSRGRSSEAEHQLPKLRTRVRFSSPAPIRNRRSDPIFKVSAIQL